MYGISSVVYMLPATIVEMNKFPMIQFLIPSYYSPIMFSKAADKGLWMVLLKIFFGSLILRVT